MNNVSVCMITKNESEKLEKCLSSIKKYGFEIVVVDTGSTDNTDEIIRQYADVHGKFEWCDNFAAARNYSIGLASNDLVLVLDSDEWVEHCDLVFIRIMNNNLNGNIGRLERVNDILSDEGIVKGKERISRIFDRRFFEYRGRIHEQVVPRKIRDEEDDSSEYNLIDVPITIGHSGYAGTVSENKEKAQRNIRLLQLDLEEFGKDPYVLYQLGKSYYLQKDYDAAAIHFEEGLGFNLDPQLEYVQDMVETYGYCLLQLKRFEEMMFLREIYDSFAVSADYVFLIGLAYMNNCMYEEAIGEFRKATTYTYCKVEGCNSFKALYNAGVIEECLGRKKEAHSYYQQCGNYAPALKGIERLKSGK